MESDFVELLATVEDTFGFAISEEDASRLSTVGQLNDYIVSRRFSDPRDGCLTAITFHKIQRAMMWVLKVARHDVRPSTHVAAIIPSHRCRVWRRLEKATGLRLPQLRRPAWVMRGSFAIALGVAVAVPWLLGLGPLNGAFFVGFLTSIAAAICLSWITVPMAFELQTDCTTIGQLAVATVARNYPAMVEEASKRRSEAEVWQMLQTIVAEHWGLPPRNITRETALHRTLVAA